MARRPQLTAAFAAHDIEPSREQEEQIVSRDLAFEGDWDVQTFKLRKGGPAQTPRQGVFLTLRRVAPRVRCARGMLQPGPPL